MTEQTKSKELKSTGYELFILLLSLLSILNLILAIDAGLIRDDSPRFEVANTYQERRTSHEP